jgi:alkylation response protein AidB-like acyl-CoA dehydrogenase
MAAPDPGGGVVALAHRLADEVLFPGAVEVDAAEVVPKARLDALAGAGLYGLAGPAWAGGLEADFPTTCAVIEALASGCVTTAFVWTQHLNGLRGAATSTNTAVRSLVEPLCRGEVRAGVALAGARPGPSSLHATPTGRGWILSGAAQWVSGWGRIQLIHTAARVDDSTVVWLLVDAASDLSVERLPLIALNATATVCVDFDGVVVPDERVTAVVALEDPDPAEPAKLRTHAAFALGVTARCCTLIGPGPLDDELVSCRGALDTADAGSIAVARAAASELAVRAAVALMSVTGSRSLIAGGHEQRLAREALFVAVYAARPPVRAALLEQLGAAPPPA